MLTLAAYLLVALALLAGGSRLVRRLDAKERLFLLVAPLCVVGPALVSGRVLAPLDQYAYFAPGTDAHVVPDARPKYYQFDVFTKFIPWRIAAKEALSNGALPIWNPHMQSGDPLLGATESALLHPFVLLSLLLPWAAGWMLVQALTLLLAVLSGYLLLRSLGRRRSLAYLGGAAWMLSAYLLFWLQYPVALASAHLPLTVLCFLRLARRRNAGWFLLTTGALVLHLVGGHPESALYCVAGAGLLGLCSLKRPFVRSLGAYLSRAALACVVATAISAAALLPMLDTAFQTEEHAIRSTVYAQERRSVEWRTAARRWAPTVLPGLFGRAGVEERADKPAFLPPASSYCGSICLLLALAALWSKRFRLLRWGVAGLAGLGTLIAAKTPGVVDLVAALPLFDIGIPEYFTVWGAFGISTLAGMSDELFERRERAVVAAVLGFVALLAGIVLTAPGMRGAGLSEAFVTRNAATLLVPAALFLGWLGLRVPRRARLAGALVLLVSQRVVELGPEAASYEPALLDEVRGAIRELDSSRGPSRVLGMGERLIPNVATLGDLEDPRGYTALTLREYAETSRYWSQGSYPLLNRVDDLGSPLLSFLNVRWAVAGLDDAVPAGWRVRRRGPSYQLLENRGALPRAYLPTEIEVCSDRARLMERLDEVEDFAAIGLLEGPGLPGAAPCSRAANASGRVDSALAANGLDLVATLDREGWVVVSQAAWRGWIARSGGVRLPLVRANGAFLAIRAPEGISNVKLRFRPLAVTLGGWISGVTLLLAATAVGVSRIRRSRA